MDPPCGSSRSTSKSWRRSAPRSWRASCTRQRSPWSPPGKPRCRSWAVASRPTRSRRSSVPWWSADAPGNTAHEELSDTRISRRTDSESQVPMSRFEILEDDEAGDYDTLDDAIDALEGGRTALRWMLAALVGESFFIASLLLLLVAAVVIGFDRVGFAALITGGIGVYGY